MHLLSDQSKRYQSLSTTDLLFTMTGACGVPGGVSSVNLNLLYALAEIASEAGIGLTVFSFQETDLHRPEFLPDWVKYVAFNRNKFRLASSLLNFAHKKPIYIFDYLKLALPVLPLASTGLARTVIFAHGQEYWRSASVLDRLSLSTASCVLTNSFYTLRKMEEKLHHFNGEACLLGLSPHFKLNKAILPASVEPIHLEACDGKDYSLGNHVFLLVARIDSRERQKGHNHLINVLPLLLKHYPDLQLVFPGPGDDRKALAQMARSKGVASAVFLPGCVSIEMLERLYRHCYAFVMPSRQEGFGLVYLEAMNFGKPCVGCFDQGAEDVIVDGETGLLIKDPGNPQELLRVLNNLLCDSNRAAQMGFRGFQRLHAYFTAGHFQQRIKKSLVSLL